MRKPRRKEYIVNDEPSPCPECPEYSTCTSLCEKAELWVNQDSVGLVSHTIMLENGSTPEKVFILGYPDDFLDIMNHYGGNQKWEDNHDSDVSKLAWEEFLSLKCSRKTVEFVDLYYRQGKRIRDVAIELGITSSAADRRHQQAKASIKRRLRRRHIWENVLKDYDYFDFLHREICCLVFRDFKLQREVADILNIHQAHISKVVAGTVRKLIADGLIEDTGKRI